MKLLFIQLFLLFLFSFRAQENFLLTGNINDGKEPLPFATIMIKGTTYGTNSNENGKYSLKLPRGNYEVIYQYVGYSRKIVNIELSSNKTMDVTLKPDGIALKEVEVNAGEDPAYPIMRKAIKKKEVLPRTTECLYMHGLYQGTSANNQTSEKYWSTTKIRGR